MIRILFIIMCLLSLKLYGTPKLLKDLADGLGGTVHSNRPDVFEDQLGGYATGGSLHFRKKQDNLRLLTIAPPSFRMGCGGLDFYTGGFGYLNKDKFIEFFKSFATNSAIGMTYGAMLALKTLSPQISDLIDNIENIAREINSINLDGCQMGMSLADNMFSKNKASKEMACQNSKVGESGNFFDARRACSNENTVLESTKEGGNGLLGTDYNLVWQALKEDGMPKENKEFLMSLSGTILSKQEGGKIHLSHKHGLVRDQKLLDEIIFGKHGGELKMLSCDEPEKCLNPSETDLVIAANDSLIARIRKLLESMADKFLKEHEENSAESLSAEEKHLVSHSSVPILKLLSLNVGLKGRAVVATVEDYTEAVAYDYVTSYLNSLLELTHKSLLNLELNTVDAEAIMKDFKDELSRGKQNLFKERASAFERLSTLLSVKQRTKSLEKMVFGAFANYR